MQQHESHAAGQLGESIMRPMATRVSWCGVTTHTGASGIEVEGRWLALAGRGIPRCQRPSTHSQD